MTVEASLSKCAHPLRSNRPRSSSSGPPGACITPSTETWAVVVSFMVAVTFSLSSSLIGWLTWPWSHGSPLALALDCFFREDRVDLADSLGSAHIRASGQDPLHGLGARIATLDGHTGAPDVDLLDRDARRGRRHIGVRHPVRVCEPVAEDKSMRRFGLQDLPVAVVPVALGPSHLVCDVTAGRELVPCDASGVARRAPPALELTRIGPQLPHPLGRRIELGFDCHREPLRILADGGDGHGWLSLVAESNSRPTAATPARATHRARLRLSS